MTDQTDRIEALFAEALAKPSPEERAAFLNQACADDPPVRGRVEVLLKAHDQAGSFLQEQARGRQETVDSQPIREGPGTVIGPYRLMEQIGQGGMGLVFVAEQQEPVRRKVAFKVIKPGMDSHDVIARFEAERQALALMDHPNIARVLDAGTTNGGRPYFVMELVKGIPITDYCDQSQMTPRQRLELFVSVCQAVQHAHQKGVIHRDLKPSNVLVTQYDGTPVAKVIDFGIAKAVGQHLTDKTVYTRFAQMIGTPMYMSPEQAEMSGLDIDTRSDIYSLGVLLYELLTGTTPFDEERLRTAGFDDMRRIIREEEPPRPSTRLSTLGATLATVSARRKTEPGKLSALVRGELDWIVMKALEKNRNRRYETATSLGQDIQRYLADEPVLAGPPSAGYRLRKFARRHRGAVLSAALVLLALLTGVIGATGGLLQAMAARDEEAVQRQAALDAEAKARANEHEAKEARDQAQRLAQEEKAARSRAEFQALRAETALHAIKLDQALRAWEQQDVAEAEQKLGEFEFERQMFRQTWEQRHLTELCRRKATPLVGRWNQDRSHINSVAFGSDGHHILLGSEDKTVRLWDAATGVEELTLKGHTGAVTSAVFGADKKHIVSGSEDQTVKVWDMATGQEKFALKGHTDKVTSVACSSNGRHIVSASADKTVKVWDAATGQEKLTLKGHTDIVTGVAISADGQTIVSVSPDKTVKVWDAATGQAKFNLKGHTGTVHCVALSADGKHIVSGGTQYFARGDGEMKVWDTATGQVKHTLRGHREAVRGLAFSSDGLEIVSGCGRGTIKVWDAATGQEKLTLRGSGTSISSVAIRPDGRRIISGHLFNGRVTVWDTTTPQEALAFLGHRGGVCSVALSADGKRVVSGSFDQTGKAWDRATGKEFFTLKGQRTGVFLGVAISGDGQSIATGGGFGTVDLWDATTGQHKLAVQVQTGNAVACVTFSSDGRRIASGNTDSAVKLWDTATGEEKLALKGQSSSINGIAFSPDGQRLVAISEAKTVMWDAATGKELLTLKGAVGYCVAFSPDGQRIATGSGTIKVWDAVTGEEKFTLKGHRGIVYSVAFSPDGQRIVSGSEDKTVKLWDVTTGQEKLTLKGHTDTVYSVAISRDGQRIVSGSRDGSVRVWDAPLAKP